MADKEFPLSLVIRAVDKATGPMRAITARLAKQTAFSKALAADRANFAEAIGLSKITGAFKGIGSAMGNVGAQVFALGAKLVSFAGVATTALFAIVHSAVNAGDELATMADRVGMGIDAFASLRQAANLADVDQEAFNGSMDQFNKRLGQMKANGGPMLAFLQQVSPALAKQVKGAKSTEAAFGLVSDAMKQLGGDTQKQAALADAVFGKGGKGMAAFMKQGGAAIQKQQLEYLRLAGSQEAFARGAGDLDNAVKNVETAFIGLRSAALGALFPALTDLAGVLSEFLVSNREGITAWAKETATVITEWVKGGGIQRLTDGLKNFLAILNPVVQKLGGWLPVLAGIAAFLLAGPLLSSLAGLAAAFVSLVVALAPIAPLLVGFAIAAGPALAVAAAFAAIGALIYLAWDPLSDLIQAVADTCVGLSDVLGGVLTLDFDRVVGGWTRAVEGFAQALAPALTLMTFLPGGATIANAIAGQLAPTAPAAQTSGRVSVDFSNVPRGVNVSAEPNSSQPLDLSVGRSMQ